MKRTAFVIMVMGTRGKSSTTDSVANYLKSAGLSIMSRQTGIVPVVKVDDQNFYIKRNEPEIEFNQEIETPLVMDHFLEGSNLDGVVIENNAISRIHMSMLNEYINPEIVIITTTSPDHILDQGTHPKLTTRIFLNSIPSRAKIIFWTNHPEELAAIKSLSLKADNPVILFSQLAERDHLILREVHKELLNHHPFLAEPEAYPSSATTPKLIKPEIVAKLSRGRTLINLGSVNDLMHSQMFLDEVAADYEGPYYLLVNFRADRDERTWLFMEYILPRISKSFDGVLIRSEHPVFSASYIKRYISRYFPGIISIPFETFNEFNNHVVNLLPEKAIIIVLANTANDFGFELIQEYRLFQDSYPILRDVNINSIA